MQGQNRNRPSKELTRSYQPAIVARFSFLFSLSSFGWIGSTSALPRKASLALLQGISSNLSVSSNLYSRLRRTRAH